MRFILACAGPLAMDMDALKVFCRSVIDGQPALYDSTVIDVPWRSTKPKTSLRIGLLPEDPIYPLHPPIKRVLREATVLLKAQGHKIIPLDPKECRFAELNEVAWNIFSLDSSAARLVEAAGEPVTPAIIHIMQQVKQLSQFHTPTLPDTKDMDRLGKLAVFNSHRMELREVWRKLWHHHNLDICLAPSAQSTAVLHDKFGISPYTSFLNCLDVGSAHMLQYIT